MGFLKSLFQGIQGKFLLFFLIMDSVVLGGLMYSVSRDTGEALMSQIGNQLGITARNVSGIIDDEVHLKFTPMRRLSHDPLLARAAAATGLTPELRKAVVELLRQSAQGEHFHGIADLYLLDPRGRTVATTALHPEEFQGAPWLPLVARERQHAWALRGPVPKLRFAFAILSERSWVGELVAEFDLSFVDEIAEREPTFDTALVSRTGEVYRGELPPSFVSRYRNLEAHPGLSQVIDDQDKLYAAFVTPNVPGIDWSVVLSIPKETVLGPVWDLKLKFARVGALSALILAFLVVWRIRALISPLRDLERTMHRIMDKRSLNQRAQVRSRDEVGALATTFNQLLESLAAQSEELVRSHRELELQRSKSIDTAKMAALGEMAGGLAHEINTPLAVINLCASQALEILDSEPAGSAQYSATMHKVLEKIEGTSMRIAKIVKGMRSFSRQAGDDPYQRASLESIVEETLTLCQERFKYHSVRLLVDPLPPGLSIECRPTQIQQVLLNLLNNAHDAIENLPEKWVRITVEDDGEQARITVTDSGPGIPAALRTRIFQPFFTTKEVGRGTGLGLSISQGIIEEHSGTLAINAQSPHTQFVIRLPKRLKAAAA